MSLLYKFSPRLHAAANAANRSLRLYLHDRSLRAWMALGSHFWKRIRGIPAPTYVTIAITYRCQVRCDHCYANSPNRPREDELTTEQIKSVIKQVKDLGALTVHFSGGEPLLRKDIFDLIVYARSLGLLTRVNTNGLLLNEENVKKLKAAGLTECGVSLDSADPDIHDRFRGAPGLFDKTVQGIRRLAEHKILIRVMTVAMKESIPEGVADTVALVRGLGARFVYILIPIASGSWKDSFDQLLNSRERAQLRALQDLKMAHLEMQTASTNCCVFRNAILYISANGNVTPCAFTPFVLGNVKEHPLSKIWRHHCADMKLECRGDCPLNIPAEREALRQHVSQVAEQLGGGRPSDPPRV